MIFNDIPEGICHEATVAPSVSISYRTIHQVLRTEGHQNTFTFLELPLQSPNCTESPARTTRTLKDRRVWELTLDWMLACANTLGGDLWGPHLHFDLRYKAVISPVQRWRERDVDPDKAGRTPVQIGWHNGACQSVSYLVSRLQMKIKRVLPVSPQSVCLARTSWLSVT